MQAVRVPCAATTIRKSAAEAPNRITDTIGIAPFVDVGTVADGLVPDFSERLQWAAGLGAIYQSPVGPIRLDIAVPINGRDVDDSFEIYISIGQSF